MWKTIFAITFLGILIDSCMHNYMASWAGFAHRFCLDLSPSESTYRPLYSAMVCGADPAMSQITAHLRAVGLYHLLVVSGSHLIFIEILLLYIFKPLGKPGEWLIFIALIIFTLICNVAAPVMRAMISFMLRKINEESKLFWSGHNLTLASGIVTLLLFPAWLNSLSFVMSWSAALYVSLPVKSSLRKHIVIFLGLIPIVYSLQPMHPITSLINWLVAPLLGFILLPLCVVAFAFSPAVYLVDLFWLAVDKVTTVIALEIPSQNATTKTIFLLSWFYIFFAQIIIYFILRNMRRRMALNTH
ncbi:MAG: hypothetical protein A2Z20_03010 [Bdellovibrionales bacterium RBG_16_40_8]|nr:MAG: hypothetical protein A2Z20_03010 [Bdellovibrionales bacterium RBG_16_40_8]